MVQLDLCDSNVTTSLWINTDRNNDLINETWISSPNQSLNNGTMNETKNGMPIELYQYFCPPLIIACFISVVINSALFIVGHIHTHNKSPVLRLSLNLASTDTLASLLSGFGLLFNSYLPVVYNINLSRCFFLVYEIFRVSALIASVLHLLALACIHYKGIVNPLHYRNITFCSSHVSTSIHLISCLCWLLPIAIFTLYYLSIPCQGFRSSECTIEFFLLFNYRFLVLVCFLLPLILMFGLYIKIFCLIKKYEFERSVLSAVPSLDPSSSPKTASHIIVKQPTNNNQNNWMRHILKSSAQDEKDSTQVIYEVNREEVALKNLNPPAALQSNGNLSVKDNLEVKSQCSTPRKSPHRPSPSPHMAAENTHWKALSTTLIVLGTYLICWMPAVLYFALTCVDGCPFPIGNISDKSRLIAGFVTNALVILKAIVDPFIYTLRMADVKVALKRCAGIDRRDRQKTARSLALSRSIN